MQTEGGLTALLRGVDAVINCVGIIGRDPRKVYRLTRRHLMVLFRACAAAKLRKVVQISALGADGATFSAYHLSKRAADDCLRSLDLDRFVLRPSLPVYRPGGQSAANVHARVAAWPLIPVLGDGQQMLQPVHISDVVAAVLRSLDPDATPQTLDIVGRSAWRLQSGCKPCALPRVNREQGCCRCHSRWPGGFLRAAVCFAHGATGELAHAPEGCWADPNPFGCSFLGRASSPVRGPVLSDAASPCDPQGVPS